MEKRKSKNTDGGNVNWYNYYEKQLDVSKAIKNRATIQSSNSSVYIPVENKNTIQKYIQTSMFTVTLFIILKICK